MTNVSPASQDMLAKILLAQQGPAALQNYQNLQDQAALGDAIRQQGLTPIDTSNRMVGPVMSRVSPFEGVAKLAQAVLGTYEKRQANEELAKMTAQAYGGGVGPNGQPVAADSFTRNALTGKALGLEGDAYNAYLASGGNGSAAQTLLSNKLAPNVSVGGAILTPNGWQSPVTDPNYAAAAAGLEGNKAFASKAAELAAQNAPVGTGAPGALPPRMANVPPPPAPAVGLGPGANEISNAIGPLDALTNAPNLAAPAGGTPPTPQQVPGMLGNSTPSPEASAPQPNAGESNAQYQARMEAWKAGQVAHQQDASKNIADAEKAKATVDSRIESALYTLQQMKKLAPNVTWGLAGDTRRQFDQQFMPEQAANNASFKNHNSRLFIQELPAIIQGTGGRGNQFLERAIQDAGAIDENDPPAAKLRVINNLETALRQSQQMAGNVVEGLKGKSLAPTPQASYQEGMTATNPQTGERLMFRGGQWVRQ